MGSGREKLPDNLECQCNRGLYFPSLMKASPSSGARQYWFAIRTGSQDLVP